MVVRESLTQQVVVMVVEMVFRGSLVASGGCFKTNDQGVLDFTFLGSTWVSALKHSCNGQVGGFPSNGASFKDNGSG